MAQADRALMPDYLRVFALFGIVVVNINTIAFSFQADTFAPKGGIWIDQMAAWLVHGLAFTKSFGLFSFMFGVGLGFLMRSAERRGLAFGRLYRNRMIGLLFLGVAHGFLFYPGDILVTYAVFGTLLYFCRNWSVKRLVWCAAVLLLFQVLIFAPFTAFGVALGKTALAVDPAVLAHEAQVMTSGNWLDTVMLRTGDYLEILPFILAFQGTVVLGWFFLGLAAVKANVIDDADHRVWRFARRFVLVPSLAISLYGAYEWQWGDLTLGVGLVMAVAPIVTLGYLGLIAALAKAPGAVMSKVLAAGRNSLSVYLGQSIILSTIFAAYGLGLWDQFGEAAAVATAVIVTGVLIGLVSIWCRYFAVGPFEWVLRKITYFHEQR